MEEERTRGDGDEFRIRELVRQSRAGDSGAFAHVVRRFAPKAYGLAFSFLRNHEEAEDISQDAFVRAFRNLETFEPSHSFEAWLMTIVANLSRNRLRWRKLRARLTLSLDEPVEREEETEARPEPPDRGRESDPAQAADGSFLRGRVQEALERLPDQQQTAVRLKFMEGYKISEVARLMGVNDGTVKTHIFRGLEKLRKTLGEEKIELS